MDKITKAVIPIAGFGTRFLPYTKSVPKEMLPIIDTPVIHFIVQEAIDSGIEEILFIINDQKQSVVDYFQTNQQLEKTLIEKNEQKKLKQIPHLEKKVKISYLKQKEAVGSGAAVRLAKDFVDNQFFAVLYGDDLFFGKPVLKQLINKHYQTKTSILAVKEIEPSLKHLYGIIEEKDGQIQNFFEKPTSNTTDSNLASLGRYILSPNIFAKITEKYQKGKEIYLTDAFIRLMQEEKFYICQIKNKHYDTGSKQGYFEVILETATTHKDIKGE